jgi:hypothetical protein
MKTIPPRASSGSNRSRRGVVLAAAVACLFLTVLLSAGLAVSAVHRYRQLERQERDLQAAWLAESAVQRARALVRLNPDYTGETWLVPAEELNSQYSGTIVIAVAADDANAKRRRATIEAHYPDEPVNRTRVVKEIVWPSPENMGHTQP